MDRKVVNFSMIVLLTVVSMPTPGSRAFEVKTHEKLSLRALQSTTLDSYLREVLRLEFQDGVQQLFNGKVVRNWIEFGSKEEDDPWWRLQQHFHDPTKAWNQAGTLGISSVIWSQLLNQGNGVGGGNHSWRDARESYYRALTGTTNAQREQDWADTFQSVGQVIHLVQDAASPAHTRNDLHISLLDTDRMHVWGNEEGLAVVDASASVRYDPSILNLPPNNLAPIPIARIIDTEKLRGGIPSEGLDIGIAEYSNANFFSDDTIFDSNYQAPTDLGFIAEPGPNGKLTQYLYRHPSSTSRYKLAVAGTLADSVTLPFYRQQWALDDYVMTDYGKKVFPRAIGYSAGLIDYFFRGKIDSTSWYPGYVLVPWGAQPSSIVVENVSVKVDGTNEQGGEGTMQLVLLYSYRFVDTPRGGAPEVVVSHPVPVSSSSSPQSLVFSFDSLPFPSTFPAGSGSHAYGYVGLLVYKGALGQESEAVVGAGYCINANNGSRYNRVYQFEHSAPGVWFDEGAAYIDYFGC